ncbi:MAG: hypothetical protein AB7Q23_02115 [Hyphomonadaceae bacterium]
MAIAGVLIAGAAWAYFEFGGRETASLVPQPAAEEQSLADVSQDLPPVAMPSAEPAPASAPRSATRMPAPAPRTQDSPPPIDAPDQAPVTPDAPDDPPPAG